MEERERRLKNYINEVITLYCTLYKFGDIPTSTKIQIAVCTDHTLRFGVNTRLARENLLLYNELVEFKPINAISNRRAQENVEELYK